MAVRRIALVAVLLLGMLAVASAGMEKYNARKGAEFLAEKEQEEGVTKTASGLLYKVLERGSGTRSPSRSDRVQVNYAGTLIDGTEFDSSYKRGQPATFGVSGVIAGWTEALQLMHEGDVFELYIPSELAYGERGAGGLIGPRATLVFKVELLKIM